MARGTTRAATKKSTAIRIDFTGVETASVVPEGEYICEVKSAKLEESDGGGEYIAWQLKIADGKHAGKTLYNNTSLKPQSLWATKRFLECLGLTVPDGPYDFEPAEAIGLSIGVMVEHGEYRGRTRSQVSDVFPAEDGEGGGDEEGSDEGEEDAGELPTPEEIGEMGKAELRELVEKHDLDIELTGTTSSQRRQVINALKDKAPAAGKKKAAKKYSSDDINGMDEEALEELVETHELEVNLDKLTTIRKKRSAVIDALEEAELLVEDE